MNNRQASKSIWAITAATSLLIIGCVSGCATTTTTITTPAQSSSSTATGPMKVVKDTRYDNLEVPQNIPDGRTLTGITHTAELPPIKPMVENPAPQLPVKLQDFQGTSVEVKDISRIVPIDIYGTTSQALIALGIKNNIVGRSISDTDPQIAQIPSVTHGGHDVNMEALLALGPTIVITDRTLGNQNMVKTLRDSGVTVVVLDPERSDTKITAQLEMIAKAVGLETVGKTLAKNITDEIAKVRAYVKQLAAHTQPSMRMAMLYVRGTGGIFFIFGRGSAAPALVKDLDGIDVAGDGGIGEIVPANAEAIARINPELILVMKDGLASTGGLDGILARPGVAQTTAGEKRRVVAAPDAQILSFGVNYPGALKVIADAVYLGK